jgi:hypothetical protein
LKHNDSCSCLEWDCLVDVATMRTRVREEGTGISYDI